MKSRDIAIVGILLAIGAILRYLSNVIPGAIVANPIIALYCLALILIRPSVRDALGIGLVAGVVSALISHSIFPPANLISEPIGALVCVAVYGMLYKRILGPGIATLLATLASGFSFLLISLFVIVFSVVSAPGESFTIEAFVIAVSPIVVFTAIANSAVTQILYFPASRILMRGASGSAGKGKGKAKSSRSGAEEPFGRESADGAGARKIPGPSESLTESATRSDEVIRFNGYTYQYPQGEQPSLVDVTTTIHRGECVLISGPTGAGKTTFCLAATGVLHHEYGGTATGSIGIFGKDVGEYEDLGEIGQHIGMVFDDADAQLIFTTVEEEILSGLENRGFSEDEVHARLEEVLTLTNTANLRHRPPHTLSGGQKQRLALAATLAGGTDCLFLDEATAELDTRSTTMVLGILARLKEEGKTIIVVEQKFDELIHLADRIICLENGRITGEMTPEEAAAREASSDSKTSDPLPELLSGSPEPSAPLVVIEDLVHSYGSVTALKGVNLTIGAGELVAIVGENGSGKTTLCKHLNGLLRPTSGRVLVDGQDTKDVSITQLATTVGLVFQNPDTMLFADTVEKEILFGLRNIGRGEDAASVSAALDEVGLAGTLSRFPRSMSRGERQRLAIACVTAMNPAIIILDEPTTGLDPREAERIMQIIGQLNKQGQTILMISHDMGIVARHAHRVITMDAGRIVSDTGGV